MVTARRPMRWARPSAADLPRSVLTNMYKLACGDAGGLDCNRIHAWLRDVDLGRSTMPSAMLRMGQSAADGRDITAGFSKHAEHVFPFGPAILMGVAGLTPIARPHVVDEP